MRFIKTEKIKPGMVLAKNLYDKNYTCMLSANKELSYSLISKIKDLGYSGVMIYDEFSDYEELKGILSDDQRSKMIKSLKDFDVDQTVFLANELVNALMENSDVMLDLGVLRSHDNYTYEHSVNVALLATACGVEFGLTNNQLQELSSAAMLHDIGKRKIPLEILNKTGKLTDKERIVINKHPQYGYDLLYGNHMISASTRAGVLLHHENWDGSGYPYGYKKSRIPLYARIIHVADVYDALCAKRSYKEDYNPAEAIEYLMGNGGTMFDTEVVTKFLKCVVIYPVGCEVKLSDGRIARVVGNNHGFALRPKIVDIETKERIDLLNELNLTILQEN